MLLEIAGSSFDSEVSSVNPTDVLPQGLVQYMEVFNEDFIQLYRRSRSQQFRYFKDQCISYQLGTLQSRFIDEVRDQNLVDNFVKSHFGNEFAFHNFLLRIVKQLLIDMFSAVKIQLRLLSYLLR